MTQRTAILFFATDPLVDEKTQRFPRHLAPVFRSAFGILHKRTAALLRETGLPVFHSNESNQTETGFGKRITHALAGVFECGYESVLVVGNDSPDLCRGDLEKAIARLGAGHNVLGPSADGGAYLIGIHRKSFSPETWEDLPWCTPRLFQSLLVLLFERGIPQLGLLRCLNDLDHAEGIRQWLKHPARWVLDELRTLLFALIAEKPAGEFARDFPFIARSISFSKGLRAPPRYA